MMGYKDDVKIDKHSLDTEWETQAEKYTDWAEASTDADDERDRLQHKLEILYAKKAMRIRKNPKTFGLDKITDSGIKDVILLIGDYEELYLKFLDAKKNASILNKVGSRSFEHKKRALEKLTDLYFNNYFAEPRIRKEVKKSFEDEGRMKHREALKNIEGIGGRKNAKRR